MTEKDLVLDLQNLYVRFEVEDGIVRAVNGISLQVERGKTLGLVGETGAGKTTTALGIMGLVPSPPGRVVEGEILFEGEDLLKKSQLALRLHRGRDFSMVFQDPMTSLNPLLSIGEQVAEVLRLHEKLSRKDATKRAAKVLEEVGLAPDRMGDFPHELSGGMKQRVGLAMALACSPRLLIADEPTTALDVTIQDQVLELIRSLKKRLGTAMLLISHDLGVVAENCDRVAIIYAGRIVESGRVEEVYRKRTHPYTRGLFDSLPDIKSDKRRLKPIGGLMADPSQLPQGCPFHPRCPRVIEECRKIDPEKTQLSSSHYVRCWNYYED